MEELGSLPLTLDNLKRVRIEPGDTLVLQHPGLLSCRARDRIAAVMSEVFPGTKVVVLEEGMTLGIDGKKEVSWEANR